MSIGEITAVIAVLITITGIFVRYGIIIPMKNIIQPLEFSITDLTNSLKESQQDRKDIHAQLKLHDTRLTIQEQQTQAASRQLDRIEKKVEQLHQ